MLLALQEDPIRELHQVVDFPTGALRARELELRATNEEDSRNHSQAVEKCVASQVREEGLEHKVHKEVVLICRSHKEMVLINLNRAAVGTINQFGEVMDSSSKVVGTITDEGNRALDEEVMDNLAPGEDIKVKWSLKNQDILKVDSIRSQLVEDSIKSPPAADSIKRQPVVDSIKSQPVAGDIKLEGTVDTLKVRHPYRAIISPQFVQIRTSQVTKLGIKHHLRAEGTVNRLAFLKQRHLPFKNQP